MSEFSRETLLNIIETDHVQCGEASALARMALAAMDREPVAYMYRDNLHSDARFSLESKIGNWSPEDINEYEISETPLYRHAQQPVVPATLPCSVELKPGLIIGKGCKTETLLTALRRRADYNADIDAMTPEERAEHDGSIKAFKAMLQAGNSPVITGAEQRIADAVELLQKAAPAMLADNGGPDGPLAGRLKSPVIPEGYVMVPKEATEKMLIAGLEEANPLGGLIDWDASRGDCNTRAQVQGIFKSMLAAAPQEVQGE
ncbi:hypothetical protein ACYA22_01665 [Klebsiella pneumoniae]